MINNPKRIFLVLLIICTLVLTLSSCQILYQFIDPASLGHTTHMYMYGEEEIIKEPTCLTDGERRMTCVECGQTITEVIPSFGGHHAGDWITVTEESEENDGVYQTKCVNCELVLDTEITHNLGEPVVKIAPTLVDNGVVVFSCTRCGSYSEEQESAPLLDFTLYGDEYSVKIRKGVKLPELDELIIPNKYNGLPVTAIDTGGFQYLNVKSLIIPEGIVNIGARAFLSSTFTSITLPSTIEIMWDDVFVSCSNLSDVYISDIGAWCNIAFLPNSPKGGPTTYYANPLAIADNLYLNGELVSDIVIPDGITSLSPYVLSCDSLKTVVLSDSVTTISNSAFSECNELSAVTFGNGLEMIDTHAFYCCTKLTSITLPSSLQAINGGAFYGCENLAEVVNNSSLNIVAGSTENGRVAFYATVVRSDDEDND